MRKSFHRPKRKIQKPKDCYFCKNAKEPDYKDTETLKHFITERGKIVGKMYNGLCEKHQSQLARAVKRARFIALLPFIVRSGV